MNALFSQAEEQSPAVWLQTARVRPPGSFPTEDFPETVPWVYALLKLQWIVLCLKWMISHRIIFLHHFHTIWGIVSKIFSTMIHVVLISYITLICTISRKTCSDVFVHFLVGVSGWFFISALLIFMHAIIYSKS